jgi:hypothetical protein
MKEFIRLGTQFIGYRDYADNLKGIPLLSLPVEQIFLCCFVVTLSFFLLLEALAIANKCADDLALELEKSEKAREKAELDVASVESLRKRLHEAETALSEHTSQQLAREGDISARLESQNWRFVSKFTNHVDRVASNIIFYVYLLITRNLFQQGR